MKPNEQGVLCQPESVTIYEADTCKCTVYIANDDDSGRWYYGCNWRLRDEGGGFYPNTDDDSYQTREEAIMQACRWMECHMPEELKRTGSFDAVRRKAHIREFTLFDFIRQ